MCPVDCQRVLRPPSGMHTRIISSLKEKAGVSSDLRKRGRAFSGSVSHERGIPSPYLNAEQVKKTVRGQRTQTGTSSCIQLPALSSLLYLNILYAYVAQRHPLSLRQKIDQCEERQDAALHASDRKAKRCQSLVSAGPSQQDLREQS